MIKHDFPSLRRTMFPLAACALALLAAGCGSEPGSAGPDPQSEAARLDQVTKLRAFYTKAKGDYSKLSATDKAEFEKLAGGGAKAQTTWQQMAGGPPAENHDKAPSGG